MSTKPAGGASPARATGPQRRGSGRLSETAENYLLSLRILEEDGIAPHVSQLAEFLRNIPAAEGMGTTLASVSGMIHRMSREGMLEVNKSKQIVLTPAGERLAHDAVRRHRLSERLLTDILGLPLERAETEAHRLEHSISPELLKYIEEKLGYPDTCPYGRHIDREGEIGPRPEPPEVVRLSQTTAGKSYTVVQIADEVYDLLSFFVQNKIVPGQRIRVADVAPFRGVVDLERDDEKVSMSIDAAARIRVRLAND